MDETEKDSWVSLEQAVRLTYENMAARWKREDMELIKSRDLIPGVGGRKDLTADESDGGGAYDAVTHPSLSIRPGFMDAKAAIRTESE